MPNKFTIVDRKKMVAENALLRSFLKAFSKSEMQKAAIMEKTLSSFSDPGPDYSRFELKDADGNTIAVREIAGY